MPPDAAAELPPLSLYVHVPWCTRKCPYCDFNSHQATAPLPENEYLDALQRDLEAEARHVSGRPVGSIFIGGGTPSLFSGAVIGQLLDGIDSRLGVAGNAEITLEANPGSAEARRFAEFRAAGVNRLSIGVQSFRDAQLHRLGRVHSGADALQAVEIAARVGFDNLNLDLMYGLPADDVAGSISDLEIAIARAPAHLSWYQLTLEPNTAFHRRPPPLPEDAVVAEIESAGRLRLAEAGYRRYEISGYARPGRECRHNMNYWQFGDYLGVGAGAHGKLTRPGAAGIERRAKPRNPRTYMAVAGCPGATAVEQIAAPETLRLEFAMNALRLPAGVDVGLFEMRTGLSRASLAGARAAGVERGWLVSDPQRLQTTPRGLEMLNALLELF